MSDISEINQGGASRFHRVITDPVNIAMLMLLAILSYLVILPFVQLLIETLTWGQGDRRISREAVPVNLLGSIGCRQPQARYQARCFTDRWLTH